MIGNEIKIAIVNYVNDNKSNLNNPIPKNENYFLHKNNMIMINYRVNNSLSLRCFLNADPNE